MMSEQDHTGRETFIVVDVEAAGPHPGKYALLSIGACTVHAPRQTFYIELKPDAHETEQEAMQVHHLSLSVLAESGAHPREAMQSFASWVEQVTPAGAQPVFIAFNAPFDWMFVNEYFYRYLQRNPFGHKALDVKAFFMGLKGSTWAETSYARICAHYGIKAMLSHHAVEDAILEADLFALMLADSQSKKEMET